MKYRHPLVTDISRKLFLLLAVLSVFSAVSGQDRTGVRNEIRQAEAEIARINKLVGTTRKEQGVTLGHLNLIGTRIENRQKIVLGIETEISAVSGQLQTKNSEVAELQKRYDQLKCSYSALIRMAYKNYRNNSFLSFLFSARDFTDAARRLYYVKRISGDMQRKAEQLTGLRRELGDEVAELDARKSELDGLQQQHATEVSQLEEEQGQLKKTQEQLKGKEKELLAEADKRRRQIAELERQLQRAVNDEVRKNSGRGSAAGASSPITAQFTSRKGKLIRPVDGVVVDKYGLHNHPIQKGVKVNNKGVNIAAAAGSEVRCVYGGEVRKVFFFQGLGNSVMVRHGSYLTIYANLETVFVREGENIMESQPLGSVAKAPSGQQATLHFEVWQESNNLDPEQWIRR